MPTNIQLHAIVSGDVQGVFFRASTKKLAESLSIVGTVKNLRDGTVEIYAQGPKEKLDEMLDHLCGPNGPGSVSQVDKSFVEPQQTFHDFRVIY